MYVPKYKHTCTCARIQTDRQTHTHVRIISIVLMLFNFFFVIRGTGKEGQVDDRHYQENITFGQLGLVSILNY